MKIGELKCKYCKIEMFIDGMDYHFKYSYDNYYFCDKCGARAIERVRGGKRVSVEWLENTEEEDK